MKERLQKLIAQSGLTSRRTAEEWIARGRVTVNGQVARVGDSADPACDQVLVDGRPLAVGQELVYLLLYKPAGYVTTLKDPQGRPRVVDLLPSFRHRVFPVGRLDLTTEGLLLLTNDGALAHRLMHPRHQIDKTYLVRVRGQLTAEARSLLEQGVMLEDGMTSPARIERIRNRQGHSWFEITLREGRNRQVRRMCDAVGCPVSRLKRIRYADLSLGNLNPGEFRYLQPQEVERLKSLASLK